MVGWSKLEKRKFKERLKEELWRKKDFHGKVSFSEDRIHCIHFYPKAITHRRIIDFVTDSEDVLEMFDIRNRSYIMLFWSGLHPMPDFLVIWGNYGDRIEEMDLQRRNDTEVHLKISIVRFD